MCAYNKSTHILNVDYSKGPNLWGDIVSKDFHYSGMIQCSECGEKKSWKKAKSFNVDERRERKAAAILRDLVNCQRKKKGWGPLNVWKRFVKRDLTITSQPFFFSSMVFTYCL